MSQMNVSIPEEKEKKSKKPQQEKGERPQQQQNKEPKQPKEGGSSSKSQQQQQPQQDRKTKDESKAAGTSSNQPTPQRTPSGGGGGKKAGSDVAGAATALDTNRLKLFDQLLPKKSSNVVVDSLLIDPDPSLHPATLKLGALYKHGTVRDDDDRIVALIQAFISIIQDYTTPTNKQMRDDLDKYIKLQVNYLIQCRQHCMGMGNLIKLLRLYISNIKADRTEAESKQTLIRMLSNFLEERILYAQQSIINHCIGMIKDNDVILTFGSSPLIRQVLLAAAKHRTFRVVIVDTRPLRDGLQTLQAMSNNVPCVYTPLSGAPIIMRDVTRVLLGASALLSNGTMLAPAGTAMVAAIAKSFRIPVIVAAESYKCCEKVQLDAIVYNELGSTREIAHMAPATEDDIAFLASTLSKEEKDDKEGGDSEKEKKLPPVGTMMPLAQTEVATYRGSVDRLDNSLPFQVINLRYDLTQIHNISVVATETGLIPPTSVPVLIRELKSGEEQQ